MISSAITVTTTPTLLIAETANATRTIYINPVGNDIHLGGNAVTSSTGLTVVKGTTLQVTIPPQNALYAVVATGSHTCTVLQPEGDY